MFSKWLFLLLATVVMSELSGDVETRRNHHHVSIHGILRLIAQLDFVLIGLLAFQVVRSEQHSRQTRAALKPLGFFGKLAYMGGLLFQVPLTFSLCLFE